MKRFRFIPLLVLLVTMGGCSSLGANDDEPIDLTGDWYGTIVTPSGQQNGIRLTIAQLGDDLSGSYRESELLANGRVRSTGGSLNGVIAEDGRIEFILGDARLCKPSLKGARLTGGYVVTSRPGLNGMLSVERQ